MSNEVKGILYPFERGDDGNFRFGGGNELVESDIKTIIFIEKNERPVFKNVGNAAISRIFDNLTDVNSLTALKSLIADSINQFVQYAEVKAEEIVIKKRTPVNKIDKTIIEATVPYYSTINGQKESIDIPFPLE